jgi:hypothetical protein
MTTEVESKMVPRRRILPFLGLAAVAGLALRSTAAEAQTSGMERRQDRRGERVDRRYERPRRHACIKTACTRPGRNTKIVVKL